MDLNQLLYFRTVAHLGNITRASELHYASQSCISKNIQRLEQEVGAKLFIRTHGQMELTEEGRAFLEVVEESVSRLQQGLDALAQRKMPKRTLSVSCTMNFRVDSILATLASKYPEHSFKVVERGYRHLKESFEQEEIDLAFVSRPHTQEGLICQRIAWAQLYLVVHKNHPLANKQEASLLDLVNEKFLIDLTIIDKEMLLSACAAMGFLPDICFQVKNILSAQELLKNNLCIGLLPSLGPLFQEEVNAELHLVKLKENLPPVYIGVVYPKSKDTLIQTPIYQDAINLFAAQIKDELSAGDERWRLYQSNSLGIQEQECN